MKSSNNTWKRLYEPFPILIYSSLILFFVFLFLSGFRFYYIFFSILFLACFIFCTPFGIKRNIMQFLQDTAIIKRNYDFIGNYYYYNYFPKVYYRFDDSKLEIWISGHISSDIDLNQFIREDLHMRLIEVQYDFDFLKLKMVDRPKLKSFDWNHESRNK